MTTASLTYQELLTNNQLLQTEVDSLKQQLEWFKKQFFGKKSERIISTESTEQLLLFPQMTPVEKDSGTPVKEHTRKKNPEEKTQIAIPQNLPTERVEIDLPEEEKICKVTGEALVKIGEEVTRKLAHRPGSFYIKEIVRPKYAAAGKKEAGVQVAPLSSFLNRCTADESLLASLLVSKYADHLPLYRLSEIFRREEIHLPRQVLSDWVVRSAKALAPLYYEMEKRVLTSGVLFMDETPLDLQEKGKGKLHTGFMWVLCGGEKAPYQVYHFFKDRKHQNAETLLKDYQGLLHSDAYGAYAKQADKEHIVWIPCWAHIRRKFFEAPTADPLREWMLEKLQAFFLLERRAWESPPEERLKMRRMEQEPLIDELIARVKQTLYERKLLPKSKLSEAVGYFCSLIPHLKNFLAYPEARLDNNCAERAIRPLAIGRKNWLFVGSEGGAEAAAIAFSLIQTCRSLNINPRDYLEDVMRRLLDHPASQLYALLPDQWAKSRHP